MTTEPKSDASVEFMCGACEDTGFKGGRAFALGRAPDADNACDVCRARTQPPTTLRCSAYGPESAKVCGCPLCSAAQAETAAPAPVPVAVSWMIEALRAAHNTLACAVAALNAPRFVDAGGEEIETDDEYAERLEPEVSTFTAALGGYNVRLRALLAHAETVGETAPDEQPWANLRRDVAEVDASDLYDEFDGSMGMSMDVCGTYFPPA